MKILRKYLLQFRKNRIRKKVINSKHDVLELNRKNIVDMRKHNFSFSESSIYDLKSNDYREYINTFEAYAPRLSNSPYFVISDDKYLFSVVFEKYINTPKTLALIQNGEIVSLGNERVSNLNLYDLFLQNGGGVIKDRGGCDGFNVYVFSVVGEQLFYKETSVDRKELEKIVKKFSRGMVQDKLGQGEFENNIYNKSINTIRVITMRKENSYEHEIVGALQRIGTKKSMPVDNFNQGGGSALIDIESGELGSMTCINSFDEKGKRIYYDTHPDSGAKIKGQVIPNWEFIKSSLIEVTRKLPFFEYIAWDVVLQDDGIAVIETNMKSSLNVFQVHGGMRNSLIGEKYREKGYIK